MKQGAVIMAWTARQPPGEVTGRGQIEDGLKVDPMLCHPPWGGWWSIKEKAEWRMNKSLGPEPKMVVPLPEIENTGMKA